MVFRLKVVIKFKSSLPTIFGVINDGPLTNSRKYSKYFERIENQKYILKLERVVLF